MIKRTTALLLLAVGLYADTDIERANRLFQRTDYAGALQVLERVEPKDGPVYELMGRSYFMNADFKNAVECFEKAIAASPNNSEYHLWLGRAFGRRAETSTVFLAPRLAAKARKSFERAVELNPKNLEAINDLFEYYLEAPGFLGGGIDKAAALSEKIRGLDPVEYHYAQAKLAEQRKEYQQAEQQLRRAVELAPGQVGRFLDLARFLYGHGKVQEGEAVFAEAEKIAPENPKLMFERASLYVKNKRNLEQARVLLNKYLKANLTPDDPPKEEARKLLRQASGS